MENINKFYCFHETANFLSSQNSAMASPRDHIAAPIRYELNSRERYIILEMYVNLSAKSCDCGLESKRLIAHEDPQNDL